MSPSTHFRQDLSGLLESRIGRRNWLMKCSERFLVQAQLEDLRIQEIVLQLSQREGKNPDRHAPDNQRVTEEIAAASLKVTNLQREEYQYLQAIPE